MQSPTRTARYLFCLGFLSLAACTTTVEIVTDDVEPHLVITGALCNRATTHIITVASTGPYFSPELPENLRGAEVQINGVSLETNQNGIFYTKSDFMPVPGETYRLDVYIDFDRDGRPECYSATTTVPEVHVLDSINLAMLFPKKTINPPWFIVGSFRDSPGEDYYGAALYVNSHNYSNRLLRYYVHNLNDYGREGQYVQFPIMEWIISKELPWDNANTFPLYQGDVLTVELQTLSKEFYEFLSVAKEEVSQQVPLFSGPRGNVRGNISGGALGVFGSYTVSRASTVIPSCSGMPVREDATRNE